jgi:hypothetical protein
VPSIRRLGASGFSGSLDLEQYEALPSWENITYTLEVLAPNGQWQAFAHGVASAISAAPTVNGPSSRKGPGGSLINKHFPLRDKDGSFFQLVAPARYRVAFWKNAQPLTTKEFEVGQRHLALGRF